MNRKFLSLFIILGFLPAPVRTGNADAPIGNDSWPVLLDRAASNPFLSRARDRLIARARELAAAGIVKRPRSLEEIGKFRTWLDGRSRNLEPEIKETFALAMADFGACKTLAEELPVLAAAYRLTRDETFLRRVEEQLEETAEWSPLQRPGWTLYAPGNRLPPDGKDGNWLATGLGVRAIADALEILPENSLAPSLVRRLHQLLLSEIRSIADDWKTERSWFIRGNNPITNQWVLPTEGLVRACLVLGKEKHPDAYELGIANLLKALDAHGSKGEFEEGFGYASFTASSFCHIARALAVAGDLRAVEHPFLKNFPTWLIHHFQPGGYIVNCFDAGGAYGTAERTRPLLSMLAVCTGSKTARWALDYYVDGPSDDLFGLAAATLPEASPDWAPPLYASYRHAARVNWRSSWDSDATGVWVRGGHPLDQHDHQDRGHVSFILRGKPLLIEAGTPSYDHPLLATHYSSGAGHNVLQLGTDFPAGPLPAGKNVSLPGWQKPHTVAPITVFHLNREGGDVMVDGSEGYGGLERWERRVKWTTDRIEIDDNVVLGEGRQEIILFRWHLGTENTASIESEGTSHTVSWEDVRLRIVSSAPFAVEQTAMPDHTLKGHDGSDSARNRHTCIVVRTEEPVHALTVRTTAAREKETGG